MYLDFKRNSEILTLGVEMEIQLLDNETLKLKPIAPEILDELKNDKIIKEMFRSTLEVITGISRNVQEVHDDLYKSLLLVKLAGHSKQVCFAGTGTHPMADYNNRILSATERYHELLDRNQWLIRRMAVYGLHVHIGMAGGDECIRFNNFFLYFIPHLIALSASSPFWKCLDTGLSASRPTVYEAHPTSGIPYLVNNWDEFNNLYQKLVNTGSIESVKDIWWDLRPSPALGTLEIRICDGPATMLELESIVAWIHLLSHWFQDNGDKFFLKNTMLPQQWILRENKWRTIRHGTSANLIDHKTLETYKLSDRIMHWLELLDPYIEKLGYQKYASCVKDILQKGNSSERQRRVMARHNDIRQVVEFNIKEFELGQPIWD